MWLYSLKAVLIFRILIVGMNAVIRSALHRTNCIVWICDVNGNALSLSQPIRHLLLLFVICADFFAIGLYLSIGLGPEEDYTERDFMAFYAASRLPYNETYEADKQRELQERIKQKPFEVFVNPPFIVPIFKAVMDDHYIRSYKRWVEGSSWCSHSSAVC